MEELSRHKIAYATLILGMVVIVLLYLAAWPILFWQRLVAVLAAVFYTSWGITTHLHQDEINKRLFLEYLGVGIIGGLIAVLITF